MLLIGYLYYQLYINTEEGSKYANKTLPVILKKYVPKDNPKNVIIYANNYFGIFGFSEFLDICASCNVIMNFIDIYLLLLLLLLFYTINKN